MRTDLNDPKVERARLQRTALTAIQRTLLQYIDGEMKARRATSDLASFSEPLALL